MRFLMSVLMIGLLIACTQQRSGRDDMENNLYQPLPRVEFSILTVRDHIASVYVRHSRGAVLFRLSPESREDACAVHACSLKTIVTLYSPAGITFCSSRYETFDRSYDMFGDGSVVLVPLAEDDANAAGVFVNLTSGKSYFFIPSLASVDYLVKLPRGIKLVAPENVRGVKELTPFPQFER
jgi:hypothetical protein